MKNVIPYEKRGALVSFLKTIACIVFFSGLLSFRSLAFFTVTFTSHPSPATVCQGSTATFSVVASSSTSSPMTYQWQVFSGGAWSNISNNSTYGNATTAILTVANVTSAMSGLQYRCIVSDGVAATSNPAALTVSGLVAPPVNMTNGPHYICSAGSGGIAADFTTDPTIANFQWQVSTDNGLTWTNTTDGATYSGSFTNSASSNEGLLNIASGAGLDHYLYHYIATGTNGCAATSAIDTLHSLSPTITVPGSTVSICPGSTGSIAMTINDEVPISSYKWFLGSSGTALVDGAPYNNTATGALGITPTGTTLNGGKYKLTIVDAYNCTVTSSQVTLLVPSVTLTKSPLNVDTCAGSVVTFSVTFTSTGTTPTRQWQTDNGTTAAGGPVVWTNVGTNSSSYSPGAITMAMDGYHYRCIVTSSSSCNSVTSNESVLHAASSGTWLGGIDTNWHVAGNWCGGVPVSTTDVLIPNWAPNMPTISPTTGTAFWHTLTMQSGTSLRITGGAYPYNLASSAYTLGGTVAYIGDLDQYILPATHTSLMVGGSLNKLLQTNTAVTSTLTLGGSAKIITGTNNLIMKAGSNPIAGGIFGGPASSWIVTGNGSAGATNTGLGGLTIEQVGGTQVLYPIGPTTTAYNPANISNSGTVDNFTLAVNDQPLPGSIINSGVNNSWLLSEQTAGGSTLALQLQWNQPQEQSSYVRTSSQILRSNGSAIVQYTPVLPVAGANPYTSAGGAFSTLTQFSVASYTMLLPVRLTGFTARRAGALNQIDWQVAGQEQPDNYIVERSADGAVFSEIATIPAGSGKLMYTYADKDPGAAVTYYRLKMMTHDTRTLLYSQTVTVTNQQGAVRVELRPSITVGNETNLFIILPQRTVISCTLTDAIGRVLARQAMALDKGEQTIALHFGSLARGIYYLRVAGSEGMIKLLPLVKQ